MLALGFHSINLLLRSAAWHTIVRAAYPDIRYRWRSSAGAYFAGVGVNAIAPAWPFILECLIGASDPVWKMGASWG